MHASSSSRTPGSMSKAPARPCTTTALLCRNSLSWTSTPSATWLSTDLPSTSLLPPTDEGNGGGLRHPRRDLALIEILHGRRLDAARGLAHPHRRHRRFRVELGPADEHQLHVA